MLVINEICTEITRNDWLNGAEKSSLKSLRSVISQYEMLTLPIQIDGLIATAETRPKELSLSSCFIKMHSNINANVAPFLKPKIIKLNTVKVANVFNMYLTAAIEKAITKKYVLKNQRHCLINL